MRLLESWLKAQGQKTVFVRAGTPSGELPVSPVPAMGESRFVAPLYVKTREKDAD